MLPRRSARDRAWWSAEGLGQILSMLALAAAIAYWGGHADALLDFLVRAVGDQESRIRCVENQHRQCPKEGAEWIVPQ